MKMKLKTTKRNYLKMNVTILVAALTFFISSNFILVNSEVSLAVGETNIPSESNETSETGEYAICSDAIIDFLDEQDKEFQQYMQDSAATPDATSSLVVDANLKLQQYRSTVKTKLAELNDPESNINFLTSSQQIFDCQRLIDEHIAQSITASNSTLLSSMSDKKTNVYDQELTVINDGLDAMNREVAQMYALLLSFDQKLPTFTKQ